jgi:hypothetical protein
MFIVGNFRLQSIVKNVGTIYHTSMKPQIVLDTNILVAALRSRRGAAFRLVSLLPAERFEINVSVLSLNMRRFYTNTVRRSA